MPTYEYECEQCGIRFERMQRMTDKPLTVCPECGGHIHRVMQPVGIIFKGSGFYVTDNRSKSSTALPATKHHEEPTTETTAGSNGDTKSIGGETKKVSATGDGKSKKEEGSRA